jgi:hypothetical protein
MAEQKRENALLAREMTVNGRFRDLNFIGDSLDGKVFTAVFEDQLCRGFDDLLLPELRFFSLRDHRLAPASERVRLSMLRTYGPNAALVSTRLRYERIISFAAKGSNEVS